MRAADDKGDRSGETMSAAVLERCGAGRVEIRPWPRPAPGPGELLVRVRAAGVNPRDWMMVTGIYPFRFTLPRGPFVLGADLAGEVAEVGPGVIGWHAGDRVCAMQTLAGRLGAFATYCVVKAAVCVAIPDVLSNEEAAGLPLAGLTALQGLGDDLAGHSVLVIGASGGVGHFAVQIAAAAGARVTGVSSERNVEFLHDLGCRNVVNYERERFSDTTSRYRVILDAAGRESPAVCRNVLAADGRHVTTVPRREALRRAAADLVLGRLPGRRPTRLILVRSRGADLQRLVDLAAAGRLRVAIQRVWPLVALDEALAVSRAGHTRGKLVLSLADP